MEIALELKARCFLQLCRFEDIADMLRDYIPSLKLSGDDSSSASSSSSSEGSLQVLSRERSEFLPSLSSADDPGCKCLSVKELTRRVRGGVWKNCHKQGRWRYLVLGQACCHLGLLEDAVVLLQTGKCLTLAAFRRESICWSDDSFSPANIPEEAMSGTQPNMPTHLLVEVEFTTQLLIQSRMAAVASLDAGLASEVVRHFGKILDGWHSSPQGFLA